MPLRPRIGPRVQEARRVLSVAKDSYHQEPCERKRETVAAEKEKLKTCYRQVEEEGLTRKIRLVEETADRCKNKESWSLVYDITGKNRSSSGLIDGGSAEARLKNWKTHFSKLLGEPPRVPDEDLPIRNIHPPLDMKTGPFTMEELSDAKKQLVEGKACGEDGITAEILKRVDVDRIILSFFSTACRRRRQKDQLRISNL